MYMPVHINVCVGTKALHSIILNVGIQWLQIVPRRINAFLLTYSSCISAQALLDIMQSTTCHFHAVSHKGNMSNYNSVNKNKECWRLSTNFNFILLDAWRQWQQYNSSDNSICHKLHFKPCIAVQWWHSANLGTALYINKYIHVHTWNGTEAEIV